MSDADEETWNCLTQFGYHGERRTADLLWGNNFLHPDELLTSAQLITKAELDLYFSSRQRDAAESRGSNFPPDLGGIGWFSDKLKLLFSPEKGSVPIWR